MNKSIQPQFGLTGFNCPFCGAFAKQHWYVVGSGNLMKPDGSINYYQSFTLFESNYALCKCESCQNYAAWNMIYKDDDNTVDSIMIYPKSLQRSFDLTYIPPNHANDYTEACIVLDDSPKASAALSRRCLQAILREQGFKDSNLDKEISKALDSQKFTSEINDCLDAIRHFGNIAAHSTTDHVTGQILNVEPGEASWLLDTLEELFDHLYVKPERIKQKRAAANAKLAAAGKPPLK